jgi:hypothetical protein
VLDSIIIEGYLIPGVLPSSRMLPIGGITARVTPKLGVKVELQEDPQQSTITTISLIGRLEPPMSDETLRIDLLDPEDRLRVLETKTDALGQFRGEFDLTIKPSLDARSIEEAEEPVRGVYKVQAFVFNSPHAAETESNIVYAKK